MQLPRYCLLSAIALLTFAVPGFAATAVETSPKNEYRIHNCNSTEVAGVEIHVMDAPASHVLRDVIQLKHLHVTHPERVTDALISLQFACVSLRDLIPLLAFVSGGLSAQPDGNSGFKIGMIWHQGEIIEQQKKVIEHRKDGDTAQEKIALEKIIALAKPVNSDDLEDYVVEEYSDLAEIAIKEKDYARAEELERARLAQIERFRNNDNDEYALALADLARARGRQSTLETAHILQRAVAMMEKHPGTSTLPALARGYANLAAMAFEAKQFDKAEALSDRAYAVLTKPDQANWNSFELYQARTAFELVEADLANESVQEDRKAAAARHYERVLGVSRTHNEDMFPTTFFREMVAMLSEQPQQIADVGDYYSRHVAAASKDDVSKELANALFNLALVRAKQEKYPEAITAWKKLIDLRIHYRGANSPQVLTSLGDLALLQRLNGQAAEAAATEKQADSIHPDDSNSVRLGGGLETELRKPLAPFLHQHFEAQLSSLTEHEPKNEQALAHVREQLGYCKTTLLRLFLDPSGRKKQ